MERVVTAQDFVEQMLHVADVDLMILGVLMVVLECIAVH